MDVSGLERVASERTGPRLAYGLSARGVGLTLAELLCAYGVSTAWPEGAKSFTTVEVKCNLIGTAL